MKIEYELFAHHYILSGDKNKAYKAAYPDASGEALKIAARRLVNHPDVRQYISDRLAATQQEAVNRYHEEEQRLAEQEYALHSSSFATRMYSNSDSIANIPSS